MSYVLDYIHISNKVQRSVSIKPNHLGVFQGGIGRARSSRHMIASCDHDVMVISVYSGS